MPINNLIDASQQQNVAGALQQMLLGRLASPEQAQQLDQRRQAALEQYQNSLRQPRQGNITPSEVQLTEWIANMGRTTPGAALAGGIAAGGRQQALNEANRVSGDIAASRVGYEDTVGLDKLDQSELAALRMGTSTAVKAKTASAESLRPLYKTALEQARQLAKNVQFTNPQEELEWIKKTTNDIVVDYTTRYGVDVNPVTMSQLHTETMGGTTGAGRPGAVTTKLPQPEVPEGAPQQATMPIGAPQRLAPTPQVAAIQEAPVGKFVGDPQQIRAEILRMTDPVEREAALKAFDEQAATGDDKLFAQSNPRFAQTRPQGAPAFRNKPNEKMMEKGAGAMGEAYAKDYLTIQEQALGAKEQHDALRNLENIDPNTNAFANVSGYIGAALQGLGADPNTPLIQDAIKNRQANIIVSQMKNAALTQQKGVQTRSDEVRIADELAKTSDPVQVWKYAIQIGKERTQRKMEQLEYADAVAAQNNGVPVSARARWMKEFANDPITQRIGGRLVFRTPTIEAYMRKYPDADKAEAISYWRSLEKGGK